MLHVVNEDYHINNFVSGKDVYINFDKWRNGEINKCCILGLSGSGKSSLARKISDDWKCYCVECDKFRGNVYYTDQELKDDHPLIWEYFTKVWTKGDRHNIQKMEHEERRKEFKDFFYWLLDRPERMVIEGAVEKFIVENDQLKKFPLVFKSTSMMKSMGRMITRELQREHRGRSTLDTLCWVINWCAKYGQMKDKYNNTRDVILQDVDPEDYEEIDEATGYKRNPILISDDDVYVNFDKWESGKSKVLLITALSGSGKSTIAKKFAEKYRAYYIAIDIISFAIGVLHPEHANWEYIKENDKYLYEFFKEKNYSPDIMTKFKDYQDIKKKKITNEYIHWLCFDRKSDEPIVVEGGDVAIALADDDDLLQFPIVFKGTSIIKSMLRRFMRARGKHDTLYALNMVIKKFAVQYAKMIPEVNVAREKVMSNMEYEEIEEGFLPTPSFTFYHGSDKKFDHLEANCFSAGNRFHKPGWACFLFRDKHLAKAWAICRAVNNICSLARMDKAFEKKSSSKDTLYGYPTNDGLFNTKFRFIVVDEIYEELKRMCAGLKYYVYTVTAPFDEKFSLGTTNTLPEFTYEGNLDIDKREEFELSEEEFEQMFDKVSRKEFDAIKKQKHHNDNVRGLLGYILYDMEDRKRMRKKVVEKMKAGDLKVGDDLGFLNESAGFEFKPLQVPVGEEYDPKTGKYIAHINDDKYLGMFEADEQEYLKKITFKSFPNIRFGAPQPVITIDGAQYRPRCEVLVLDGNKVLIDRTNNRGGMGYSLMGGGIDPSESIMVGARRECEEEALLIPKKIFYTGIAWMLEFANKNVAYDGSISFVCIALKGPKYKGYVKVADRDSFVDNATWVDYTKFKLGKPHKKAIELFKDQLMQESFIHPIDMSFLTEEYY